MTILRPDATTTLNGVKINEYLLTKHNPNHIDMPSVSMAGKIIGVTVHNTDWITVASGTTPAEQYTRATVNNNMKDVRVHYYVDNVVCRTSIAFLIAGGYGIPIKLVFSTMESSSFRQKLMQTASRI